MAVPKPRQTAVLTRFRRFCGEVLRCEAQAGAPAGAGSADAASSGAQAVYDAVRVALVPYLQPPAGAAGADSLDAQARYLMACFGDDVFLNLDWAGLPAWQQLPLEKQFFGTTNGGTVVLQRIASLLAAPDKGAVVLAKMYLTALALGFQGDLRGLPDGARRIAGYRAELWALIAAAEPAAPSGHPFPEPYLFTLDQGTPSKLPRVRAWVAALGLMFLLWWALSYPLWQDGTAALAKTLQSIVGG